MTIADDAQAFGRMQHGGNWSIALLVVRNVAPGIPGIPAWKRDPTNKISFHEFAKLAGVSHQRVSRWYYQWERAAEMLIVPYAQTLYPGRDVQLPCEDCDDPRHRWRTYSVEMAGHPSVPRPKTVAPRKLRVVDTRRDLLELLEDMKELAKMVAAYDEFPADMVDDFMHIVEIVNRAETEIQENV